MKVLFLDIDGVVCLHEEGVINWGENEQDDIFDPDCCRRLKEILDRTGCKLVLSSSWRINRSDIDRMLEQFAIIGITKRDFIGITPRLRDRGDEILAFVKFHPYITDYLAVDDEPFASPRFPAEKLVRTEERSGITDEIRDRIISLLSRE